MARAWPFALFAVLVAVLLGPSLVGARVALPADLLAQRAPWSVSMDDREPANVELRDQLDTYYPIQRELVRRLRAGEGADWLHDVSIGVPGAAFVGWGVWSPFNLPAAVLDFSLAWSWGMALRLFAAMAGAYVLVRALGAGRLGGAIAGIAFGLSGFMVLWLGWPQSHVAAFAPWLWWATHRTVAREAPWWAGPALALATAGLWLGGFPALSAYLLVAAGVLAAQRAWTLRDDPRTAIRNLGAAAFAVSLGTGIAAFTLLPSLGILSEYSLGYRDMAWRTGLPTRALLTFVAPGFFGDVVHHRLWLGVSYVEAVGYAGAVTLGLGVAAWVIGPRRPGVGAYTALAGGALLVVYGFPPLRALLGLAPMLRSNVPTRMLAVVSLCLAVLGGLGADALQRVVRREANWDRRAARASGGVLALAAFAFLAAHPPGALRDLAYRRLPQDVAQRAGDVAAWEFSAAIGFLALGAAVTLGALWLRGRSPARAQGLLTAGLVLAVSWDLLAFAGGWNVQVPPAQVLPDAPPLEQLARASVRHRVAGSDGALLPNTHLAYGIADARAHAFVSSRFTDVLARLNARRPSPTLWDLRVEDSGRWRPWLELLGVRAVLVPEDSPTLGGVLLQERQDDVGPTLTDGLVLELREPAPRDGVVTGVLVRAGTYGRANTGDLRVRVTTPRTTVEGDMPADRLIDLAWRAVPIPPVETREGESVLVEISGTAADSGQAVSVFGHLVDGEFTPAVALDYGDDPGTAPMPDARGMALVTLDDATPVVFAASEAVTTAPGGALAHIERQGAQTRIVVVEPLRDGDPLPALPDGDGSAEVVGWQREGGRVRAEVRSDRGAVLVSLDEALDGWSATVDGRPSPVVRVNHLFTGVVVPSGVHSVELRYTPPRMALALVTAGRSLGGLAGWALLRWLRQRTGKSTKELVILAVREGQRRWIHRKARDAGGVPSDTGRNSSRNA